MYMRLHLFSHMRVQAMLHVHLAFFAIAMLENPENPEEHKYAGSFLIAYRCASAIIKLHKRYNPRIPSYLLCNNLFIAAIILGIIAVRSKGSTLAERASNEFDEALKLFELGAQYSRRVRDGLLIIRNFKSRASSQSVLENLASRKEDSRATTFGELELQVFAGHTKVFCSSRLSQPNHHAQRPDVAGLETVTISPGKLAFVESVGLDGGFQENETVKSCLAHRSGQQSSSSQDAALLSEPSMFVCNEEYYDQLDPPVLDDRPGQLDIFGNVQLDGPEWLQDWLNLDEAGVT